MLRTLEAIKIELRRTPQSDSQDRRMGMADAHSRRYRKYTKASRCSEARVDEFDQSQPLHADKSARWWTQNAVLAAAVGIAFFGAAKLGLGLPSSSGFVAVFWPAMGFGVGMLIGLGPNARWPLISAITVANFLANLSSGDPPPIATATCISEAAECLLPALLVERWFGAKFTLGRLRHVLGLLAAGGIGSAAGAASWIVLSRLFYGPTGPIPITFVHWFMSDMVGFIAVGPFVVGLFAAVRRPSPRREIIEGAVMLLAIAMVLGIIIPLPPHLWATTLPIAWLFPMLLWLTARCRPAFAAAAAFLIATTIVSTTVFGIGHFGNAEMPIDDRILQAQATVLFVAPCAFVLAALFAERRESEERLVRANLFLQRERDNKLMNIQAALASVAHEIRQPLTSKCERRIAFSCCPDLSN
jgi:integral membrane sensor domain MASE1